MTFASDALIDLDEIEAYIAADNVEAARRTVDGIRARLRILVRFPTVGRERPELGSGTRSWPLGKYVAIYRVNGGRVQIARILHSRRDIRAAVLGSG